MNHTEESTKDIMNLLEQFQRGYTERNLDKIDKFIDNLFIKDENTSILGTSAISPECSEWCKGLEAVRRIIFDDWKYWGDLKLDLNQPNISFTGDIAYIKLVGKVVEKMARENYYKYRLNLIDHMMKDESMPMKLKLLEIVRGASDTLLETEKGDEYIWPIRISALALKQDSKWKFKHIHFSYPVSFYPPIRYVE